MHAGMSEMRKITVEVPEDVLRDTDFRHFAKHCGLKLV